MAKLIEVKTAGGKPFYVNADQVREMYPDTPKAGMVNLKFIDGKETDVVINASYFASLANEAPKKHGD